ncbi:MAG TPA: hypothetical protein VGG39_37740 [Polyangiaceae bacterium]
MGSRDRITIPVDMRQDARDSDRRFEAADSDVRLAVPLHSVPWLVMTHDELRTLPLDNRGGHVLSLVDGRCTVEMILDISALPEDEAFDLLRELADLGAIEFRDR